MLEHFGEGCRAVFCLLHQGAVKHGCSTLTTEFWHLSVFSHYHWNYLVIITGICKHALVKYIQFGENNNNNNNISVANILAYSMMQTFNGQLWLKFQCLFIGVHPMRWINNLQSLRIKFFPAGGPEIQLNAVGWPLLRYIEPHSNGGFRGIAHIASLNTFWDLFIYNVNTEIAAKM